VSITSEKELQKQKKGFEQVVGVEALHVSGVCSVLDWVDATIQAGYKFTTGVVARYCGVSKVTVLRWIEKGDLPAFKLPGGQNRISRDDFFAFGTRYSIPLKNKPG